jgi:hypothetical protein
MQRDGLMDRQRERNKERNKEKSKQQCTRKHYQPKIIITSTDRRKGKKK